MPKSKQEHEVLIIGDDFVPGAQANSEIDHLLGYNTHMLDDQAIRSEPFGCSEAPNYCEDEQLVRSILRKLDVQTLLMPAQYLNKRKQKENDRNEPPYFFTVSFIYNEEHHLTIPFETEALALSCALWYVLAYHT